MTEVLEKALIGTLLKFTSRKNGRPTSVGRKHGWIAQDCKTSNVRHNFLAGGIILLI